MEVKMKRSLLIAGSLLLLMLLAGTTIMAGRLTQSAAQAQGQAPAGGGPVIVLDDGAGPVRITFAEPSELPATAMAALGLFLRRQDNSLFLGTGELTVAVEVVNDESSVSASHNGPEVEVVVTGDTLLYEDTTELPIISPEDVKQGEMVVQRTVKPVDSLAGLGENMVVRVWGEKRGDRVVADVLVYEPLK
jgi:hypothetical protein